MRINNVYNDNDIDNLVNDVKQYAPPIVYKYRSWKTPEHKSLLSDFIAWFAHPCNLKDKKDLRHPFHYKYDTGKNVELFDKIEKNIKNGDLSMSPDKVRYFANDLWLRIQSNPLEHFVNNYHELLLDCDFYNKYGLFSTCLNGTNIEMWNSNYGDKNRGYCIGLKTPELAKTFYPNVICGNVEYTTKKIEHYIHEFLGDDKLNNSFFVKTPNWCDEEEYRFLTVTINSEKDRVKNFKIDAIEEVILGYDISSQDEKTIINIIRNKYYSNIPIYKTIPNTNSGLQYLQKRLISV